MQPLSVVAAFAVLAGGGLIHGVWSQRWQTAPALLEAAARVQRLPVRIGNWQGVDTAPLEGEAEQIVQRRYDNGKQQVNVILECGRTGRMANFTPTLFFADYTIQGEPETRGLSVKGQDAEVRCVDLTPATKPGPALRIYCAWRSDGGWQAPENLKWHYRGLPYLYRIHLAFEIPQAGQPRNAGDSELLAEWLGTLEQCTGVRPNGVEKSE